MQDGVCLYDSQRRLAFASKAVMEHVDGIAMGALRVGKTMDEIARDLVAAGDLDIENETPITAAERTARAFNPQGHTIVRRHPSGRFIEISYRPIGDGYTLSVHRDITELKQRQIELERARNEVEEARRLMAAVLKALPIGISLFDADHRIVYANGPCAPRSALGACGTARRSRTRCAPRWPPATSIMAMTGCR